MIAEIYSKMEIHFQMGRDIMKCIDFHLEIILLSLISAEF